MSDQFKIKAKRGTTVKRENGITVTAGPNTMRFVSMQDIDIPMDIDPVNISIDDLPYIEFLAKAADVFLELSNKLEKIGNLSSNISKNIQEITFPFSDEVMFKPGDHILNITLKEMTILARTDIEDNTLKEIGEFIAIPSDMLSQKRLDKEGAAQYLADKLFGNKKPTDLN